MLLASYVLETLLGNWLQEMPTNSDISCERYFVVFRAADTRARHLFSAYYGTLCGRWNSILKIGVARSCESMLYSKRVQDLDVTREASKDMKCFHSHEDGKSYN